MIDYYLIMKPGIVFGNLLTFAAGFWLASQGSFDLLLFLCSFLGLGAIIASACIFNNYIDRYLDTKMERTKSRAFVTRSISPLGALSLALALFVAGNSTLFIWTNVLAVGLADLGFFIYIFLYTFLKTKTVHATLIGSLSGALPPVVGYCSVSHQFDMGAFLLFFMMLFWQMPHFYAIALYRLPDYQNAQIPVMPVSKGVRRTKLEMAIYIALLLPIMVLFTLQGYTGYLFLITSLLLTLAWLWLNYRGMKNDKHLLFGKQMFRHSLVLINVICLLFLLDSHY